MNWLKKQSVVAFGVGLSMTALTGMTVSAQERIVENPPLASVVPVDRGVQMMGTMLPETGGSYQGRSPTGEVVWDTDIKYVNATIFNPRTGENDKVELRAYSQNSIQPNAPFVAPTINMWPGETFRVNLNNQLPKKDESCKVSGDPNIPHCFNSTNLHTHGLWINPAGNSDNVLIKIDPGVKFQYEYNVPPDHPAGTFWYHPHLHGSTALQVGSGMAGALIIRGDRTPILNGSEIKSGDIDTLLRYTSGAQFNERIMLFQQIPYACRKQSGAIYKDGDGNWACPADQNVMGKIEQYGGQFGPSDWSNSGRYTSINGVVAGDFKGTEVGKIARWRLIHGGVRDTINLTVLKMPGESGKLATAKDFASDAAQEDFIANHCTGTAVKQFSFATDGLTRDFVVPQDSSRLQPGYREDLLMVFAEPGTYCLIDKESAAGGNVNNQANFNEILGFIKVAPSSDGTVVGDPAEFIQKGLMQAADKYMPNDVKITVLAALKDGLKLTAFAPHEPITAEEVTGDQGLAFNIDTGASPTRFEVGQLDDNGNPFELEPYKPGVMNRDLTLGDVDE